MTLGTKNLREEDLKPLLSKKLSLNPLSKKYADIRAEIMSLVLRQLGPELANFPRIWKSGVFISQDQAESMVYDGLLKAIDLYDHTRGKSKFSSFMWLVIGQQFKIYELYQRSMRRKAASTVSSDELGDDLVAVDKDFSVATDSMLIFSELERALSKEEQAVVNLARLGYSLSDAVRALKLSKKEGKKVLRSLREKAHAHYS